MTNSKQALLKKEQVQQAITKIANHQSRRSHSVKELSFKLSKKFSPEVIDLALTYAKNNKWLELETELCQKELERLNKNNKSWLYIKKHFKKRGLPLPPYHRDTEKQKIKQLLIKKQAFVSDKQKLKQFLAYRAFEATLVAETLSELS